jgi:hypothetical protein
MANCTGRHPNLPGIIAEVLTLYFNMLLPSCHQAETKRLPVAESGSKEDAPQSRVQ